MCRDNYLIANNHVASRRDFMIIIIINIIILTCMASTVSSFTLLLSTLLLSTLLAPAGDALALSMGGLESLESLPQSCAEQNLVSFASSVFILEYLEVLENDHIRARMLAVLEEGNQGTHMHARTHYILNTLSIRALI